MRRLLRAFLACLVFSAQLAQAQPSVLEATWRFPDSKSLRTALESPAPTPDPDLGKILFAPGDDPGVAAALAEVLAARPEDQAVLLQTMTDLRKVYDEVATKEGRRNNLASAYGFFIASNLTVFSAEQPTDKASEALYKQLESAIANTPQIATLSDAEKRQMHDWLVAMGGLSLATYVSGSMAKDEAAMQNAGALSEQSLRLVLGVEPDDMVLGDEGLLFGPPSATP